LKGKGWGAEVTKKKGEEEGRLFHKIKIPLSSGDRGKKEKRKKRFQELFQKRAKHIEQLTPYSLLKEREGGGGAVTQSFFLPMDGENKERSNDEGKRFQTGKRFPER